MIKNQVMGTVLTEAWSFDTWSWNERQLCCFRIAKKCEQKPRSPTRKGFICFDRLPWKWVSELRKASSQRPMNFIITRDKRRDLKKDRPKVFTIQQDHQILRFWEIPCSGVLVEMNFKSESDLQLSIAVTQGVIELQNWQVETWMRLICI